MGEFIVFISIVILIFHLIAYGISLLICSAFQIPLSLYIFSDVFNSLVIIFYFVTWKITKGESDG